MANSKYEYVKQFELPNILLPSTYIVVRIDGKGFHKFTDFYKFKKPNDIKGLSLMNEAAKLVMSTFPDIWIAYGQSDEYSFVLDRKSDLYKRRSDKIATVVCSAFTTAYATFFATQMGQPLTLPYLPVFDARCVCYPDTQTLRDYLSWRQVDCHINNLYNTCFWSLVESGVSRSDSEKKLAKTNAADKNELLFSQFKINYNTIEEIYKKGTVIIRERSLQDTQSDIPESIILTMETEEEKLSRKQKKKLKYQSLNQSEVEDKFVSIIKILHVDIIKDDFWVQYKGSLLV